MLPNLITLSRLMFAAGLAAWVSVWGGDGPISWGFAGSLVALAVLEEATDFLDGTVARAMGQTSELGGLLDPLCDSLARLTIYFALALAGWVTLAVPFVMVGRDLIVSYTRIIQARTGGATSARLSGKLKAGVQAGGIFLLILLAACQPGLAVAAGRWIVAGLVMATTLWSLWDYLRGSWAGIRSLRG